MICLKHKGYRQKCFTAEQGTFMRKNRKQNLYTNNAIQEINENIKVIAENTEQTNSTVSDIKNNTDELVHSNNSRFFKTSQIIAIAAGITTIIVGIITVTAMFIPKGHAQTESFSNESATNTTVEPYEIYLYPEYTSFSVGFHNDITATLNFDTESVIITAYLNSVKNGDTVIMKQKNATEWQTKVEFTEPGIFEVIATATAPNGTTVEGSVEVEVY